MLHLLKIEWLKLKNYRTFWILSILYIISLFGFNYIVHQGYSDKPPEVEMIIRETPYQFPQVWQTITYFSSILTLMPGLIVIILITNEFAFKTHRQNVIDGLSRMQFISVKMMMAVCIALVSTIMVFLAALAFGLANAGNELSFENIHFVGYFFLQTLSYLGVALIISLLAKRSGISIGIFFLYILIFDELIAFLLKRYVGQIGYYMPLESNDVLISFPFMRNAQEQLVTRPETTYLLVASVIYLVGYSFFARRRFKTADL
jgi:hypothetical protein